MRLHWLAVALRVALPSSAASRCARLLHHPTPPHSPRRSPCAASPPSLLGKGAEGLASKRRTHSNRNTTQRRASASGSFSAGRSRFPHARGRVPRTRRPRERRGPPRSLRLPTPRTDHVPRATRGTTRPRRPRRRREGPLRAVHRRCPGRDRRAARSSRRRPHAAHGDRPAHGRPLRGSRSTAASACCCW